MNNCECKAQWFALKCGTVKEETYYNKCKMQIFEVADTWDTWGNVICYFKPLSITKPNYMELLVD